MSSNKINEGVGKKIVEALKQQADVDIIPVKEEAAEGSVLVPQEPVTDAVSDVRPSFEEANSNIATFNFNATNAIDNALNNTMMNFQQQSQDINLAAVDDMELPANVGVLKQLITKLPAGVSKQTGALIIKQTMEALGISMPSVLQEAQQVQEKLTQSVRDCQTSVIEYKKQINVLELQAQKYQRQFAAINDIISLFIQTN
ncbi:hypothetical protein IKP85_01990 [bacterium]|nr:hypothetical protein [bacterium]